MMAVMILIKGREVVVMMAMMIVQVKSRKERIAREKGYQRKRKR
jgi:hypothetical protein